MSPIIIITPPPPPPGGGRQAADSDAYAEARAIIDAAETAGLRVLIVRDDE